MIIPLKIFTTEESFLLIKITIPVWFGFRMGFKPDKIVKDRFFAPRMTCMIGDPAVCLHAYVLTCGFRIRSNKIMSKVESGSKRFLFSSWAGWSQVFTSAII